MRSSHSLYLRIFYWYYCNSLSKRQNSYEKISSTVWQMAAEQDSVIRSVELVYVYIYNRIHNLLTNYSHEGSIVRIASRMEAGAQGDPEKWQDSHWMFEQNCLLRKRRRKIQYTVSAKVDCRSIENIYLRAVQTVRSTCFLLTGTQSWSDSSTNLGHGDCCN